MLRCSCRPANRLNSDAPPALHISAKAIIMKDSGKQMESPASAEVPTKLPTNIRSTML